MDIVLPDLLARIVRLKFLPRLRGQACSQLGAAHRRRGCLDIRQGCRLIRERPRQVREHCHARGLVCWRLHVLKNLVDQRNQPGSPLKFVALRRSQPLVRGTSAHTFLPFQEAGARTGLSVPDARYLGRGLSNLTQLPFDSNACLEKQFRLR
jgi:hypothetical protein